MILEFHHSAGSIYPQTDKRNIHHQSDADVSNNTYFNLSCSYYILQLIFVYVIFLAYILFHQNDKIRYYNRGVLIVY